MKKTMKTLFAALLLTVAAFAQTATTSTTLATALTNLPTINNLPPETSVVLADATNVSANGFLFVDGEVMTVNGSYVSGVNVPVGRGARGTRAVTHLSGATVYVFAPGNQARVGLVTYEQYGGCTRAIQTLLPIVSVPSGRIYDCFAGFWYYKDSAASSRYTLTIAPGAQPAATSPAVGATISVTGQAGGAQSATTSGGAAGGPVTETGGIGGAGGSSSGTGGAGGAVSTIGGAGAGTITGGAGGLATLGGGAGGAGSTAGGTGGGLNIYSGVAGSGGTGTDGAINVRQGGAAATAVFATSTAGATTVKSVGSAQSVTLTPSTSGTIKVTGGTDPSKIVSIDASGNATATTTTLAFSDTSAHTMTFPNASITVSGAVGIDCGTSAGACSITSISPTMKFVQGTATSTSATPSTVAITGISPAFTSTATMKCFAENATTVANVFSVLTAGYVSTSAVTFTGPNSLTDVIRWFCIGY